MSSINEASNNGDIERLDWWLSVAPGLKLQYTGYAMDSASRHGHIEVLDWWKNSGLELRYTEKAMY